MAVRADRYRRVVSVRVESLFGMYDHEVKLNEQDRVTIIHGPNGVGKTVLLRMVAALFGGRYSEIVDVPFERMEVCLRDGVAIEVRRVEFPRDEETDPRRFKIHLTVKSQGEVKEYDLSGLSGDEQLANSLARKFPFMSRAGTNLWEDDRDGELLTSSEVISRYGASSGRKSKDFEEPKDLQQLRSSVQTHVIEAQRLIHLSRELHERNPFARDIASSRMVMTVKMYSNELKAKMLDATANYAGESQSLDQTFPRRLMALSEDLSPSQLREQLDQLDGATAKLSQLGLLALTQSYPVSTNELDRLDDAQRRVMTLYVQDTAKKLRVLTELADRIQLVLDSVNGKFRNKTVSVTKDDGFVVRGFQQEHIDLDALSSGEQHELVLLYDLLFRVKPNTLVLIDEPELSLHVTWQKRFLPKLLAIIRKAEFDAIIATHSPFIVGDRYDLMIALDADPDGEIADQNSVKAVASHDMH